jgi:hypothetical protein
MPQADTLTILAIGFSMFLGALQMSPHHRFIPILIVVGWLIVAIGCVKLVWDSQPLIWLVIGTGVGMLGLMAGFQAIESYRSSNLKDYIFLWERNAVNWDNASGQPNARLCLTEKVIDETISPVTLNLAQQKCPARFTPIVQSQYDSLQEGTDIWITIHGNGLRFDDTELGEWRPVLSDTTHAQQYWGVIDRAIHYGKSKIGPDGVIKIHFPVGNYRVDYKIEGESKKGCSFSREGHFIVRIYDATRSNNPKISSSDHT